MWNYNRIKKSLNTNGYYAFNKYLSKSELKLNTLLKTLNYINQFSKIYKKNIEIKKYNNKLKIGDICKYNIDLLQTLHKKEMIFVKKFLVQCYIFRKTSNTCS